MVDDKFSTYKKLLEAGIETEQHYVDNFAKLPWTPDSEREYPMSDKFVLQSLTIPNNPYMTDSEVEQVIEAVVNNCVTPSS
jgi:dTDP-4-amino-4,6-dideoxygalactose transaminase